MAEYIDREALLEDIQAAVENEGMGGMVAGALKRYITRVPAADVSPVQKWISVKDRLPEPEQKVLLCTREIETYGKHNEKKKIYRNIYMGYLDGHEWITVYCYGCEYIFRMNVKFPNETIEVTHWMPLQEPTKEDNNCKES